MAEPAVSLAVTPQENGDVVIEIRIGAKRVESASEYQSQPQPQYPSYEPIEVEDLDEPQKEGDGRYEVTAEMRVEFGGPEASLRNLAEGYLYELAEDNDFEVTAIETARIDDRYWHLTAKAVGFTFLGSEGLRDEVKRALKDLIDEDGIPGTVDSVRVRNN